MEGGGGIGRGDWDSFLSGIGWVGLGYTFSLSSHRELLELEHGSGTIWEALSGFWSQVGTTLDLMMLY